MAKSGGQPKPTKQKALEGNRGKRGDLPTNELDPGGHPRCPDWLEDVGRKCWDEIVSGLPPDFLCFVDSKLLAQYCHAWEVFLMARESVLVMGLSYSDDKGITRAHPDVATMFTASEQIRKLSGHFGLSPRDRVGLAWVEQKQEPDKFGIVG